ncbi:MAG: PHP domain-containing protein [Thermoplasmata archaeon]|nr:MAG: PHP domain-containing protein [Thermoplasmata archaeon]
MKIDIHIHSSYSSDGTVAPQEILKHAKNIKLNGIAITDHNEIAGSLKLWKENKNNKDFTVIPGMEVSSSEGHILALGVKEPVQGGLTPKETIERITDLGGLAIASHPYRFWSGLGEECVRRTKFEVLEVTNSRSLKNENVKARKLADELGCGKAGGSDCHTLSHLGNAYTKLDNPTFDMDGILEEIRKGKSQGEGTSRKRNETPRYAASCVYLWLKRGMKRI